MQARAQKMISSDNNQDIHYEGNAVAWQGANRVEADRLDIDRDNQVMEAHGKVKSQFVDKDKKDDADGEGPPKPQPATAPVFTIVTAPDMVYTEENRIVTYSGGAVMKRPDMTVTAKQIRAFLKDADEDSSLDKAFADGTVKIVSTSEKLKRTRTGTSEHAEYYADDEKVILNGGQPLLVDSVKGQTRGKQLTWFANDDRLIVDGADQANPAKKHHPQDQEIVRAHPPDHRNHESVSRPESGRQCFRRVEAGRGGGSAGAERRGQDHLVLHDCRADHAGFGPRDAGRTGHHAAADVQARA